MQIIRQLLSLIHLMNILLYLPQHFIMSPQFRYLNWHAFNHKLGAQLVLIFMLARSLLAQPPSDAHFNSYGAALQ